MKESESMEHLIDEELIKVFFLRVPGGEKIYCIWEFKDYYLSYRSGRKEPKRFEKRTTSQALSANLNN